MHVIVSQGDVIPVRLLELSDRDFAWAAVHHHGALGQYALHFAVQQQHVPARVAVGGERRQRLAEAIRNGKQGQSEIRESESLWLVLDDGDSDCAEEGENAAGFGGAWEVVVAGDHHHWRRGQREAKARQFAEREEDHRVRRSDLMKDVAGDQDEVGGFTDDRIDGVSGGARDVGLPLIIS